MKNIQHCPVIDQLGYELMEAYCRAEVVNSIRNQPYYDVERIHQTIVLHRLECPICKHNAEVREEALEMNISSLN